jgi:Domain of unknown function (DUF1854)
MSDQHENSSPVAAGAFGLSHDSWGRLVLIDSSGRRHSGVEPVRAFPIADPQHWISICDAEGRELVLVEDLAKIPQQVRQVLEDELARREFVPHVRRIVKVSTDVEPSEWDVETDRGRTRFMLNSSDDVRRLSPTSALLIDVHGTRYLIEDTRQLDAASRRVLELYL